MPDAATPSALERLVREGSDADLRRFLLLLQPPQVADLLEALSDEQDRARAFRAIVGSHRSDVLRDMEETERREMLSALDAAETAQVVRDLHTDDAADVLAELDADRRAEVLRLLPPSDRAEVHKVLPLAPESAGGIMQTELVRVREDRTVREAVAKIRQTKDLVGELHEVFVVDVDGRLKGWVKERDLILAGDDDPVRAITTPVPVRVPVSMDQEEIATLVQDYDLSSVPVVDEEDRLVGRILVDDIVDVLSEEATEDIARFGGIDPEEVYAPSITRALRSRSPWLLIAFAGGVVAAVIMEQGEATVRGAGALFAFIPVIMGMGGGSSTQAATVTIRGLALGRLHPRDALKVLRREATTGFLLASGAALLLLACVTAIGQEPTVAWIAGLSIFGTICLGTTFGVLTPLVLARVGVDPAVATSPFVTTMNDILGSSLIILFATLLL